MATLLTLAPELVHRIADHMTTRDVKVLRLSCKQLTEFLECKVLRNIDLSMSKRDAEHSMDMLYSLANSPAYGAVSRSARCLTIGSLSPIHDANFWGPISENLGASCVTSTKSGYIRDSKGELSGFRDCLFGALSSLNNVHQVIWRTEYGDTEWAQTVVASALVAMPHLERLDVMLAYSRIALPLQDMRNLREITISEGNTPSNTLHNSQTFTNLAALISQSPPGLLTHIQAGHGYYDTVRTDAKPSLHEVLDSYPDQKPPLQLHHLGITNSFVKFDEKTIPHLRHLTSLDLSNILQPREHLKRRRGRFRATQQAVDPVVYESRRTVGSTADELWTQLCGLEIRLEQITLSDVVPAFLEYLASYSGLKALSLRVRGVDTEAESNALAQHFFEQTLPRHAGSLEHLMIEAAYEGLWCFGDHSASAIVACTRLRHLGLSLVTENIKDPGLRSIKSAETAIDNLIGGTSVHMPNLIDIRLYIANIERNRRSFCGTSALLHYSSATKRITDHVHRYSISVKTHPSLPAIYVGPRTFEPGRARSAMSCSSCHGEWQWRYRLVSAEPGRSNGLAIDAFIITDASKTADI